MLGNWSGPGRRDAEGQPWLLGENSCERGISGVGRYEGRYCAGQQEGMGETR